MTCHQDTTAINAVPAQLHTQGFRLLVLREFHTEDTPPAFAFVAQTLLRRPERSSRHGLSFANAFRPEIMDWLIDQLGRPSQRDDAGAARRNPRWPQVTWHREARQWPDGAQTTEWFAEVVFDAKATWDAFAAHWRSRLQGNNDAEP
jgi:hypothetical protein